jgi:hypothetical protein
MVVIEGYPKACGYGALDDSWDDDGDSIHACYEDAFWWDGHPAVRVAFCQGTDPLLVARMLRKMAGMLEVDRGRELAHLGLLHGEFDYAKRFPDDEVGMSNLYKDCKEFRQELGEEDEDDCGESE